MHYVRFYVTDQLRDDNKEERKRRRRSRWGDADTKLLIAETNVSSSTRPNAVLSQPGIAIPGQIGQPAVIIPSPSKRQHIKSKNPMLTKISRNDPALIHYARQTFGTLDLNEEQWKKAEDHYKVCYYYTLCILQAQNNFIYKVFDAMRISVSRITNK